MRWLALVLIWLLCLGLPVAFVNWTPARSAGTEPASVPAAAGQWSLHWRSSVALAPDPFAMEDEPALRVSLDGQHWQWDRVAAHESGQQELPEFNLRVQHLTLQALPKPGTPAGALRVQLLRDGETMAEEVWWVAPGAMLSASWEVDIPRLERQRGR